MNVINACSYYLIALLSALCAFGMFILPIATGKAVFGLSADGGMILVIGIVAYLLVHTGGYFASQARYALRGSRMPW